MTLQRGGFVLGLIVGLLVGLSLALGVALYITKAPIPFINKVPPRTAQQDSAEAERNRNWDPNAALGTRHDKAAASARAAASNAGAIPPASAPGKAARSPAAILAGPANAASAPKALPAGVEPFIYFVQAGAYTNADEAEQQRARLALTGMAAKISEREQAGRMVYRVRLGPFDKREDAEALQTKLTDANVDARLVRVERS